MLSIWDDRFSDKTTRQLMPCSASLNSELIAYGDLSWMVLFKQREGWLYTSGCLH